MGRAIGVAPIVVFFLCLRVALGQSSGHLANEGGEHSVVDVKSPTNDAALGEGEWIEVPADARVTVHRIEMGSGGVTSFDGAAAPTGGGALPGTAVYACQTNPGVVWVPGADRYVADDARTVAVNGCDLSGVELRYSGGGDGTGPGFDVAFALYDDCPTIGGQIIPGSEATISFDHDGIHVVQLDYSEGSVVIPRDLWIRSNFSRNDSGWYYGCIPAIGSTEYRFDSSLIPCTAHVFAGYARPGLHARLSCSGDFTQEYAAYYNSELGGHGSVGPGQDQWIADDIQLTVDQCTMISYEVAGVSYNGPYTIEAELWEACDPGTVIKGTQVSAQGTGNGAPQVFRFEFPEGIPLPDTDLWVAWRYNSDQVKAVVAGDARIGFTEDEFGLWEYTEPDECGIYTFGGTPYAGFRIILNCEGPPPIGACCGAPYWPPGSDWPVCAMTQQLSCSSSSVRWSEGNACPGRCFVTNVPCTSDDDCRTCSGGDAPCMIDADCPTGEVCENDELCGAADAFDPPCGHHACCLPPNVPGGEGCLNLPKEECLAFQDEDGHSAEWQAGRFCDAGTQSCMPWVCRASENVCCFENDEPGCLPSNCCQFVCGQDGFCCDVAWDSQCVWRAEDGCESLCTPTCVDWIEPPQHRIDARQPHPPYNSAALQTVSMIEVGDAPSPCDTCWEVCGTTASGGELAIVEIEDLDATRRNIYFNQQLSWPAVTTVRYNGATGGCYNDYLVFVTFPGDVNRDETADLEDVERYLSFLAGEGPELAFPYSCDIDRSGACNPADLLRLIDLMNGAGQLEPAMGSVMPDAQACP